MPDIARAAEVALDTVYAAVGKKPALFRLLVETAISGEDEVVTAEERDYVQAIRAEPDAANKLRIYAAALCRIHPRLAPLVTALQGAASLDSDLKALWGEISERRATNMRLFAENLALTGSLRAELSIPAAADIIWSLGSPEYYVLLVESAAGRCRSSSDGSARCLDELLLGGGKRVCHSGARVCANPESMVPAVMIVDRMRIGVEARTWRCAPE